MTGPAVRHLVLRMYGLHPYAIIACAPGKVLFDQRQHTLVSLMATCPSCLVVQAAREVFIDAGGSSHV